MASEQKLELLVRINKDTGKLDVIAGEMQKTAAAATAMQKKFEGLSSGAMLLGKSLLGLYSTREIIRFFADGIKGAEEEAESLRRLQFAIEATGKSFNKSKD